MIDKMDEGKTTFNALEKYDNVLVKLPFWQNSKIYQVKEKEDKYALLVHLANGDKWMVSKKYMDDNPDIFQVVKSK